MENAILGAVAGALMVLALVVLTMVLRRNSNADLIGQLEAAQREADDLRLRLDIAQARLEGHTGARRRDEPANEPAHEAASEGARESAPYVITDVGAEPLLFESRSEQVEVPDRLVLSATFGAPLVKVAAFTHGVRRALSAESRNRIRFQMRQEVRAARKRRRQAFKQYQRDVRAADRASEAV